MSIEWMYSGAEADCVIYGGILLYISHNKRLERKDWLAAIQLDDEDQKYCSISYRQLCPADQWT
jgi:hypothetical protein